MSSPAPASQKFRILHVITRLIVGGAQENTLLTITRLPRSRYDITLVSGPSTGPEGSLEHRIPPDVRFLLLPSLVRLPHPLNDLFALASLLKIMRRGRYHVVHTHTTKAGIVGRVAARLAGVPIIIHTPHGHAFHDYLNRLESFLLKWVERTLARWTDCIICLTETERQDHLRFGIGSASKFAVIPSGVDVDRFRSIRVDPRRKRQELGLSPSGPLIGCIARLVPVKGVDVLLEAAPRIRAAVPEAQVVFVGDGLLRPSLERRATALGLDGAAIFLGLRRDVEEILPLFDVVAIPSRNEGMGRAVVEALAAGRPVVGSRVSGIQDVLAHGDTGLLVPPGDAEALAAGVIRLLRDRSLAGAMVQRAQAQIGAYTIGAMMSQLDRLYAQCLSERGPP